MWCIRNFILCFILLCTSHLPLPTTMFKIFAANCAIFCKHVWCLPYFIFLLSLIALSPWWVWCWFFLGGAGWGGYLSYMNRCPHISGREAWILTDRMIECGTVLVSCWFAHNAEAYNIVLTHVLVIYMMYYSFQSFYCDL